MNSLKQLLDVKEKAVDDDEDEFARSMSFDLRKKATVRFAGDTRALESFAKKNNDYSIEDGPPKVSNSKRDK